MPKIWKLYAGRHYVGHVRATRDEINAEFRPLALQEARTFGVALLSPPPRRARACEGRR